MPPLAGMVSRSELEVSLESVSDPMAMCLNQGVGDAKPAVEAVPKTCLDCNQCYNHMAFAVRELIAFGVTMPSDSQGMALYRFDCRIYVFLVYHLYLLRTQGDRAIDGSRTNGPQNIIRSGHGRLAPICPTAIHHGVPVDSFRFVVFGGW